MNDLHRALANPLRRRLLVALTNHNPQSDALTPENVHEGDEDLERLRVVMYHNHLPKLEQTGLIEWDRRTHEVVRGPRFDEIRPMLPSGDAKSDTGDCMAIDNC